MPTGILQIKAISGHSGGVPGAGVQREEEVCKYIDVTTCIGCKACEVACVEWNDMPFQQTTSSILLQCAVMLESFALRCGAWTRLGLLGLACKCAWARSQMSDTPANARLVLFIPLRCRCAEPTVPPVVAK